jgi:hypothetical protein
MYICKYVYIYYVYIYISTTLLENVKLLATISSTVTEKLGLSLFGPLPRRSIFDSRQFCERRVVNKVTQG